MVTLEEGHAFQWWRQGEQKVSAVQDGWEGLRRVHLLPLHSLARLRDEFTFAARRVDSNEFERTVEPGRSRGYRRASSIIDLSFDSTSNLLVEALFRFSDTRGTTIVLTYHDYQQAGGLKLPTRIIQRIGEGPPSVIRIQRFDFSPTFPGRELDFVSRQEVSR